MPISDELLNLDYLVFSSHKTGTQTLVKTLNSNGFVSSHCHTILKNGRENNIGLTHGEFLDYLESYLIRNKRRLNTITVFREPVERHISSFFQWYGSKPLREKEVEQQSETIIYRYTIQKLQEKFIDELIKQSLVGYSESLHTICQELGISVDDLFCDKDVSPILYESDLIKLHIFRFDHLFNEPSAILSALTGKTVEIKSENTSQEKWYKDIYSEFKRTLNIPVGTIMNVYESKQDIINMMYSEGCEHLLNEAIIKYGKCNPAR